MSSPTFVTWEYEGSGKSEEAFDNVQIATVGQIVKHDVFGTCTLLCQEGVGAGDLKVKVHNDGSERALTKGHFQAVKGYNEPAIAANSQESAGVAEAEATFKKQGEQDAADSNKDVEGAANGQGNGEGGGAKDTAPEPSVEETGKDEKGEGGKPAEDSKGAGGGTGEATAPPEPAPKVADEEEKKEDLDVFEKVVEAMRHQVVRFNVEPVGCALGIFKSLMMLMPTAMNATAESGSASLLRVGQWVRERASGYFFCINAIYKPLLGFKVDRAREVHVDEEGEEQTLRLAKSSRVLGGNSGYFNGEEDDVVVALDNTRFSKVWIAVGTSDVEKVFDITEPPVADLKRAIADDYTGFAEKAMQEWAATNHKQAGNEDAFAGGLIINEAALKSTANLHALFKKWRAKPYLTASEQTAADEAAKVAKQKAAHAAKAAKPAATKAAKANNNATNNPAPITSRSKRARTSRVNLTAESSDDNSEEDDKEGGDKENKPAATARQPPAARPTIKPTLPVKPAATPTPQSAAPIRIVTSASSLRNDPTFESEAPSCPNPRATTDAAPVGNFPQQLRQQPRQQQEIASTAPIQGTVHQQFPPQQVPTGNGQQPINVQQLPHMAPSIDMLAQMFGLQHTAATPQLNIQQQQGLPAFGQLHPGLAAQYQQMFAAYMAMQAASSSAMHATSSSASSSNSATHPAVATQQQGGGKPSYAAIKARLVYESKKKEDLLESQALSEYYTELYGIRM